MLIADVVAKVKKGRKKHSMLKVFFCEFACHEKVLYFFPILDVDGEKSYDTSEGHSSTPSAGALLRNVLNVTLC